jgi:hypothetical protein
MQDGVRALTLLDGGASLVAGGAFAVSASGVSHIARWACPAFATVPGCGRNPAVLTAASVGGKSALGATVPAQPGLVGVKVRFQAPEPRALGARAHRALERPHGDDRSLKRVPREADQALRRPVRQARNLPRAL